MEYKRSWIQHVNRMPGNRLPRVMRHNSPTGRRNHRDFWIRETGTGQQVAQLHDKIYDVVVVVDDDDDDIKLRRCIICFNILPSVSRSWQLPFSKIRLFLHLFFLYIFVVSTSETNHTSRISDPPFWHPQQYVSCLHHVACSVVSYQMNWVETFPATLFFCSTVYFRFSVRGVFGFADYPCTIVNS